MQANLLYGLKISIYDMMKLTTLFLMVLSASIIADEPTQVKITTNLGEIILELNVEKAPVTVANFLGYVDDQSYNNTVFHRVIPGFMVQGGGHYADMSEAAEGDAILNEADNGLHNAPGTIAMARMNQIDSARRQFFINVGINKSLDHSRKSCTREDEAAVAAARAKGIRKPTTCKSFGYAVFGKVVSGMDSVDAIEMSETGTMGQYGDVPVTPITIMSMDRL